MRSARIEFSDRGSGKPILVHVTIEESDGTIIDKYQSDHRWAVDMASIHDLRIWQGKQPPSRPWWRGRWL